MTQSIIRSIFSINFIEYPMSVVFFKNDAPLPWQMNFQQPATPTMEGIIDLHHNIMFFMIFIVIFVSFILLRAVHLFNTDRIDILTPVSRTRHYLSLEIIWTILPLVILFWIALPSFALLYSIDHCSKIELTIKVIGRQWYWSYEIDTYVPVVKRFKLRETGINHFLSKKGNNKLSAGGFEKFISCGDTDFKLYVEAVKDWIITWQQPSNIEFTIENFNYLALFKSTELANDTNSLKPFIGSTEEWTANYRKEREDVIKDMYPDGPLTEDINDTSIIASPRCSGSLCVPGVAILRMDAVRKLVNFLGSDVIKQDATYLELDEILDTIPDEKLLEAAKFLARSSGKSFSDVEPHIQRCGNIKKWMRYSILNTSSLPQGDIDAINQILNNRKMTALSDLKAAFSYFNYTRRGQLKEQYLNAIIYNCKQNILTLAKPPVKNLKHLSLEFDSCILSDNETYKTIWKYAYWRRDTLNLEELPTSFCGWWRLLEVDNRLILPIKTKIRILVTSSDVIHSWAVPSLGVKIDACPGRLNCVYVYIKRPGVFHGQCSELCGIKHGFMPIVVHAVTKDKYNRWFADNCEIVK